MFDRNTDKTADGPSAQAHAPGWLLRGMLKNGRQNRVLAQTRSTEQDLDLIIDRVRNLAHRTAYG
jgi:hypothetical protein